MAPSPGRVFPSTPEKRRPQGTFVVVANRRRTSRARQLTLILTLHTFPVPAHTQTDAKSWKTLRRPTRSSVGCCGTQRSQLLLLLSLLLTCCCRRSFSIGESWVTPFSLAFFIPTHGKGCGERMSGNLLDLGGWKEFSEASCHRVPHSMGKPSTTYGDFHRRNIGQIHTMLIVGERPLDGGGVNNWRERVN